MFEISADDLPLFMQCNGHRRMPIADYGDEQSDARKEGTAAHWLAQIVFSGEFADTSELVDRKAPNGVYITPEIAEAVDTYLTYILRRSSAGKMEVVTTFNRGDWQVNARADHIDFVNGVLYVDDFKFGYGIEEPDGNWTLMAHAFGWSFNNSIYANEYVLTIIQPRPYHPSGKVRRVIMSRNELFERFAILNEVLTRPSETLRTGSLCGKCPSLSFCSAATMAGHNAVDVSSQIIKDDMSGDQLSEMLDTFERAQSVLKEKLKALEELTKHRLRSGMAVKNRHLEVGQGNRIWNDGLQASFVSMLTGKDVSKPGLVTPAQAKKLGVSDDVLATLTHRPNTGMKLIREDANKRAKRLLNNAAGN